MNKHCRVCPHFREGRKFMLRATLEAKRGALSLSFEGGTCEATSHNQNSYSKDTTINALAHTTKPMPKPTAMPFAISRLRLIANTIIDINAIPSRPMLTCRQLSTMLSPSVFISSGLSRRVKTTEATAKRVGGITVASIAVLFILSALKPVFYFKVASCVVT